MQALNHEIAKSKSFASSACRPFSKQLAAFWRGPLNQSSNQAMDCPQVVESRMQRGLPVHRCYYIAAGLARKIFWKLTRPRGNRAFLLWNGTGYARHPPPAPRVQE